MGNQLLYGAFGTPPQVAGNGAPSVQASTSVAVDGTPMRVAVLGVSAALALWALRKAGFKFNVGVS